MEYEEIVAVVRQASGGIGSEAADRALQATLQTLAERLPRGEARHIVQELPAELKSWIYTETDAEAFDIDEFLVRAAKREGAHTSKRPCGMRERCSSRWATRSAPRRWRTWRSFMFCECRVGR